MTTLIVRNSADFHRAIDALRGPLAESIKDVRCEGWPRLTLETDQPLDIVRCSGRITDMQESVMRLVCGIKYATADLRYFKPADKEAVHLGISYAPDGRGITIDFSGAANAALQAAKDATTRRGAKGRMATLFDWLTGAPDQPKDTWTGAALKVGLRAVDKCSPAQITATLMLATLFGLYTLGEVGKHKDTLEHAFKMHREDHQQQLRLAEVGKTIILDRDGKAAKVSERVEQALARADEAEAERLKVLASMELEHPLVRFVVNEGENVYAAALDMAPESGNATLNGLQLEGKAARAAAKAIRHAVKAKHANEGWTAQVIPANKA